MKYRLTVIADIEAPFANKELADAQAQDEIDKLRESGWIIRASGVGPLVPPQGIMDWAGTERTADSGTAKPTREYDTGDPWADSNSRDPNCPVHKNKTPW